MPRYPSSIPQLAAATVVAAMLWSAPAVAASEKSTGVSRAAVATKMALSRARIAASYYGRDYYGRDLRPSFCSGGWCGRQFVLMLGIGY